MQDRQRGIFDFEKHEASQARFKDPLSQLNRIIRWKEFLPILEEGFTQATKGLGGRPAYDRLLMLKILVLQTY